MVFLHPGVRVTGIKEWCSVFRMGESKRSRFVQRNRRLEVRFKVRMSTVCVSVLLRVVACTLPKVMSGVKLAHFKRRGKQSPSVVLEAVTNLVLCKTLDMLLNLNPTKKRHRQGWKLTIWSTIPHTQKYITIISMSSGSWVSFSMAWLKLRSRMTVSTNLFVR